MQSRVAFASSAAKSTLYRKDAGAFLACTYGLARACGPCARQTGSKLHDFPEACVQCIKNDQGASCDGSSPCKTCTENSGQTGVVCFYPGVTKHSDSVPLLGQTYNDKVCRACRSMYCTYDTLAAQRGFCRYCIQLADTWFADITAYSNKAIGRLPARDLNWLDDPDHKSRTEKYLALPNYIKVHEPDRCRTNTGTRGHTTLRRPPGYREDLRCYKLILLDPAQQKMTLES